VTGAAEAAAGNAATARVTRIAARVSVRVKRVT